MSKSIYKYVYSVVRRGDFSAMQICEDTNIDMPTAAELIWRAQKSIHDRKVKVRSKFAVM